MVKVEIIKEAKRSDGLWRCALAMFYRSVLQVCQYFGSKIVRPKGYSAVAFSKLSVPSGLRILRAFSRNGNSGRISDSGGKNKGIRDAGITADIRMLWPWSAIVCLGCCLSRQMSRHMSRHLNRHLSRHLSSHLHTCILGTLAYL